MGRSEAGAGTTSGRFTVAATREAGGLLVVVPEDADASRLAQSQLREGDAVRVAGREPIACVHFVCASGVALVAGVGFEVRRGDVLVLA